MVLFPFPNGDTLYIGVNPNGRHRENASSIEVCPPNGSTDFCWWEVDRMPIALEKRGESIAQPNNNLSFSRSIQKSVLELLSP